jgi:DNA-directed RNA polymerase specialized sigma24 family protein
MGFATALSSPDTSLVSVSDLTYVAPATREEFWERDWVYVIKLTRTLTRSPQDAEDIAADIFEKLLIRDVPAMYRPDVVSKHTKRRVTWRAFLSNQVALYCRGKQEQTDRRSFREPLWCDAPTGDNGSRWVELFGGNVWDDYPSLSESEFVTRIREYLAELPEWEGPDLVAVFEDMLARVSEGEKVSVTYLRKRFHISNSAAQETLRHIRDAIGGDQPVKPVLYEVGGVQLTADEVRDAARLLREAKGNQVRRVFSRGGHKLATAGTTWYLEFAAQEAKDYPELKAPSGSHTKGGHGDGVKRALIHRLERMTGLTVVASASEDEPEVPAEVFESRLWQLGATKEDVAELIALAQQAFGGAA